MRDEPNTREAEQEAGSVFSPSLVSGCLIGCLLIGAALRLWSIDFPAAGRFRPDEEYLISRALGFHGGDLNPHFFHYPTFYMYCLSLIFLIWKALMAIGNGFVDFASGQWLHYANSMEFHLLGRVVTAFCGVAGIAAVYQLAAVEKNRRTALLSAFLISFCFIHIRDSHFMTVDVPMTLLATVCCIFLVRVGQRGRWRDYLAAAVFGGLAASAKYTALALGVPFAAVHCFRLLREGIPLWQHREAAKALAAVFLLFAVALATSPYVVLDYKGFSQNIAMVYQFARDGLPGVDQARGFYWIMIFCLQKSFGWLLLFIFYASLAVTLLNLLRRRLTSTEVVLASFSVVLLAIYTNANWAPIRYMVLLAPAICIMSSSLIVTLMDKLWFSRRQYLLLLLIMLVVSYEPLTRAIAFDKLLAKPDTRILARAWLQRLEGSPGRKIGVRGFFYGKPELPSGFSYKTIDRMQIPHQELPELFLEEKHPIFYFSGGLDSYWRKYVNEHYRLAYLVDPFQPGDGSQADFDLSDAFYMPLSGFRHISQPGTRINIFIKKERK